MKGVVYINLIIASHSSMAQGTADTLRFLANRQDIKTINAYKDDRPIETIIDELVNVLDFKEKTLVFTDLLGGSVNQAIVLKLYKKGVYIIAGFNLALILECLSLSDEEINEDRLNEIIELARKEMVLVNTLIEKGR